MHKEFFDTGYLMLVKHLSYFYWVTEAQGCVLHDVFDSWQLSRARRPDGEQGKGLLVDGHSLLHSWFQRTVDNHQLSSAVRKLIGDLLCNSNVIEYEYVYANSVA